MVVDFVEVREGVMAEDSAAVDLVDVTVATCEVRVVATVVLEAVEEVDLVGVTAGDSAVDLVDVMVDSVAVEAEEEEDVEEVMLWILVDREPGDKRNQRTLGRVK